MLTVLIDTLPYLAFLGLLAAVLAVCLAFFWPQVEWWLLCALQRRRRTREAKHLGLPKQPRLAQRRPR